MLAKGQSYPFSVMTLSKEVACLRLASSLPRVQSPAKVKCRVVSAAAVEKSSAMPTRQAAVRLNRPMWLFPPYPLGFYFSPARTRGQEGAEGFVLGGGAFGGTAGASACPAQLARLMAEGQQPVYVFRGVFVPILVKHPARRARHMAARP